MMDFCCPASPEAGTFRDWTELILEKQHNPQSCPTSPEAGPFRNRTVLLSEKQQKRLPLLSCFFRSRITPFQ
ncbi:hypothetical protein DDT91_19280 [Algoriphagus sp. AK58]|nr:hypothetical protein [Algoriphagus sp. AK58]